MTVDAETRIGERRLINPLLLSHLRSVDEIPRAVTSALLYGTVDHRVHRCIYEGPMDGFRYRALGRVGDEYFVVYTWRGADRRLISAWKVGPDGRRRCQALLSR